MHGANPILSTLPIQFNQKATAFKSMNTAYIFNFISRPAVNTTKTFT